MSMDNRNLLFKIVENNGNTIFDYLDTEIQNMDLTTTKVVRITAMYESRPDLLSFHSYNNWNLGWLIAYHNDMLDPQSEMTVGRLVKIPSLEEYYQFMNRFKKNRQRRR